jgi:hypothetical protein
MGLVVLSLYLGGCTLFFADLDKLLPETPRAPEPPPPAINVDVAPRILSIDVDPDYLVAGFSTLLTFDLDFEDGDGDIGPSKILVRRVIKSLDGNLVVNSTPKDLEISMTKVEAYRGLAQYRLEFYVPPEGYGSIDIELYVADNKGNFSNPVVTRLPVRQIF